MFKSKTTEFLAAYQDALNWIEGLGISVNPASRLVSYRSVFQKYVSARITKTESFSNEELEKIGSEIINAYYEASEIVTIHRVFRNHEIEQLKFKIKEIVSGPVSGAFENMTASSNRARNVSFELYAASIFHAAGMTVDFSGIADAQFKSGKYSYYLECKRPQNQDRIEKNIRIANDQFRKRFSQNPEIINKRGILALSFSKIINPKNQIFQFDTIEDAKEYLNPRILAASTKYSEFIKNKINHKVVIWTGFTTIPVIVKDSGADFAIYKYPMFVNITHKTEADHDFTSTMGQTIKEVFDSNEY